MKQTVLLFLRVVVFFLVVMNAGTVGAQPYSRHNWYFGNSNLGIRFSRSDNTPTLVNNKVPLGIGGSGVATDQTNGNLLFYTDGNSIYDATHKVMPLGTGLGGNTSGNQPVAIAKVPGSTTQFYVFVNTANGTTPGSVSYRIVDMSLFGNATAPTPPLGQGLTAGNTAIPALTGNTSEAMITIQHENRRDFWLITHANGSPDYFVSLFTDAGIQFTNQISGVGLIGAAANFAWHEATGRIAVTTQEARRDIEVVNFDTSNGVITPAQTILNTGIASTGNEAIYDTEWSPGGRYLYISRPGEAGISADVFQADVANTQSSLVSILPAPIFRSYGLQMAPDTLIYHLYQETSGGPFILGSIGDSDSAAADVVYNPTAFSSNPNFNGRQFPAFAPRDSITMDVTFTSMGTCANSPVSFYPTVTPGADSLVWNFGDGNGASTWSPVHTYEAGGSYPVTVIAYLAGDTAMASQMLTITDFQLQLSLVQDTTACACELPINNGKPMANGMLCDDDTSDDMVVTVKAEGGSPTYQWFGPGGILNGQTTAQLRPDSAGYYYVIASDVSGCSAYAGVNIKEYDSLNQQANIWHFGHLAGIDFNGLPDDPPVAIEGPLDAPEGTSVICDRNGQVILSTDGQHIFVPDGAGGFTDITPDPNPPGLGGDPESTQSALIIPVPGDETLFYILTTQAADVIGGGNFELRYSLYDIKAVNNGQNGLVQYNQMLFSRSTERITSNGNWLIAHEFGNNSFRAYPISPKGIGNPVVSAIGSDHTLPIVEHAQGYMELGAGSRLAVALSTPGVSNVVELFDFIDSTGVVTNFRVADLGSTAGEVYGLEISPGGNKLFATLKGPPSEIVEFFIDSLGNPHFQQRASFTETLGAMQIGPDGQIYVARDGSTTLGTFTANEDTTNVSNLALTDFGLVGGTNSELGLPNFTQIINNPLQTPGVTAMSLCLGDSTIFSATGKDPAIDKFDWTFGDGDGQFDGGAQIGHVYGAAGTYTANVRIYNKCEVIGTFPITIVITPRPPDPTASVVMCTGDAVLDANPQDLPNLTYQWSTGETTETITVTQQAFYNVTISDNLGCSTDATLQAVDNRPQVDFGPDLTVCQNTPMAPLDAQNPGATYAWTVDGVPTGGTAQTQSVDTSVPDTVEYKVVVTDPITNCFREESIIITVNESPDWTATPFNPSTCDAADGRVDLTINSPTGTLFTYFISGPSGSFSSTDENAGVLISTPSTLDAGTYGITVIDQVSGCATINTVNINDPGFTVSGVPNTTCDPIFIDVTVDPTPGPFGPNFTYRVINNTTLAVVQPATGETALNFLTTTPLPSNNQQYTVEVTSGSCTVSSPAITIDEDPTVPVTFTVDACSDPISITANGGTSWAWTAPDGATGNGQTFTHSPPQGPQTYNVLIKQAGLCDLDTAVTVNVNNNVTADFTQSDPCADQVTLSATPTGTYTYRWYRNGALIAGGGGQNIVVGVAENQIQYRVELVNTVSGCIFSSTAKPVNVAGNVDVTLASTLACEGSPFTLTANAIPATITTFAWKLDGAALSETSSTLTETRGGQYEVSVTQSGCTVSDQINLVLSPVTAGLLNDSYIICPDPANPDPTTREVELDPGDFFSYNWFENGSPTGETTRIFTALAPGEYTVDLINSYGCASSDFTEVIEECDPRITGPNAFRPGGVNNEFFLFTFFIDDTDFNIFIFNRWGEMVFQSNARDFRWNGGYNNNASQLLPAGTYTYVVKYKSSYRPEEGVKEKRGGVVLLR